jgi:hypothetical protein
MGVKMKTFSDMQCFEICTALILFIGKLLKRAGNAAQW